MKVLIIGGGLFGVHIAAKISKKVKKIDLCEYGDRLFSGASSNNQHRFHTGLHYPRSTETISQIKKVIPSFLSEFSDCVFSIEKNIYLNANDSKVSSDYFYNKFIDSCNIYDLKLLNRFIYEEKIDKSFLTCEKGINIEKLKKKLISNLEVSNNINVIFNTRDVEKKFNEYDLIINCSYWSTNLTHPIEVKYELCSLVRMKNPFPEFSDYSFTIMDGDYVSLYKTENEKIFTLSSVKYTPFFKTTNYEIFKKCFFDLKKDFDLSKIDNNIINHGKEYFKFRHLETLESYVTPKIKLLDDNDEKRTSEIIFNKKFITLLQGKISTISDISDQITKYVEEYIKI